MAGMRVLAAACAVLAAAPAAGEEDALRRGLDGVGEKIAGQLNDEADRANERLRVSFRPARTELSGVIVYCRALSMGLRNALHESVQDWRKRMSLSSFDTAVADARAMAPPDVTMTWLWDGAESVLVEAHVLLAGERGVRYSAVLGAAELSGPERACLYTFRRNIRRIEAGEPGELLTDPSFRSDAWEANYAPGEVLSMRGCLDAADGSDESWPVVAWPDAVTGAPRNLFAPGLADECGPVVDKDEDDTAFASARSANTVAAFDEYLSSFPSGRHVAEARRLREEAVDPPPPPGTVFRDCPDCPKMVVVPAGSFEMGSPASEEGRYDYEGPQHRVTIGSNFAVGVYEVTRGEFARFVSATERSTGDSCSMREDGGWADRSGRSWRSPGFPQADSHPVVCVTWEDARAYAEWLSRETGEEYRLLSEAEWEYAARAGTRTARYWEEAAPGQCRYANGADASSGFEWATDCGDGYARTSPVGSFDPNGFDLHDVLGNAWEWVEDCWHENYARAPRDGRAWLDGQGGDCSRRVLRGGSWNDYPQFLRSAFRVRLDSGYRSYVLGFRVARMLAP